MNRRDLLNALAERNELNRKDADAVLTSFVDIVTETVARGEIVAISGFAKFARVDRKARMGRNPATGETIKIKASRKARITPLKAFKDAVMSGKGTAKKAPARKAAARGPAKKTTTKRATATRGPAKKTTTKRATAKKTTARKR